MRTIFEHLKRVLKIEEEYLEELRRQRDYRLTSLIQVEGRSIKYRRARSVFHLRIQEQISQIKTTRAKLAQLAA